MFLALSMLIKIGNYYLFKISPLPASIPDSLNTLALLFTYILDRTILINLKLPAFNFLKSSLL